VPLVLLPLSTERVRVWAWGGRQRLHDALMRERRKLAAEHPGRADFRLAYVRVHPQLERFQAVEPEPLALTWH
jgi:hypothetical protein